VNLKLQFLNVVIIIIIIIIISYLAVCNTHVSHNRKVVWGRPCSFI